MSKVICIYVKFTITTHQIWSCHVTLTSNSEKFYFLPNSILNFRKSYQIWWQLAQEQERYRQKTNWGEKHLPRPPVLIGLRYFHAWCHATKRYNLSKTFWSIVITLLSLTSLFVNNSKLSSCYCVIS